MTKLLFSLLFPLLAVSCHGQTSQQQTAQQSTEDTTTDNSILTRTIYTKTDSTKVVALLQKNAGENDVIFYARQLKGLPYVGATLEVADPERLVVNLRQLDCTTLVETTLALTMTKRQASTSFADFCRNLERLRYRDGQMDGYLSRLHYFTWWMHDNLERGNIEEVEDSEHFTATINVDNHYMSRHPAQYKFLKNHLERVDSIARMERAVSGPDGNYLPESATRLTKSELQSVHDGDIVAIVTTKDGLDYSHLGFAVWGRDNRLHLLNASSIHHKVVEEPKTLYQYLKEHSSSVGIRLLRLK